MILGLLVLFSIASAVNGIRKKVEAPSDRIRFYLRDMLVNIILLVVLLFLGPAFFFTPDIDAIRKGITIGDDILSGVLSLFLVPLLLSFTPWNVYSPKDITRADDLFGCPVCYLPSTPR